MADRDASFVVTDRGAGASPPPPAGSGRPARAMGTTAASAIAVLATVIGLIVLAWAVLFITKGRFLKGTFERIASAQAERQVRVAGDFQFYFNPVDLKFYAEGLTVANPAWAGPGNFIEAGRIDTSIATTTFLFGNRRVNWLDLVDGRADLRWDANRQRNTWTFGDPNQKGEPLDLPTIRRAALVNSSIRYEDPQMALLANVRFQTVRASGSRIDDAIRFDGDGRARGFPFTMNGAILAPNETVAGGANRLQLHIEGAKTVADVRGTLPGAFELEGSRLNLDVRGRNLADLFSVMGVAIPETRTYRLTSALTKRGPEWRFTGLKGRAGGTDLAGRLTVTQREPRILLDAVLTTRVLDIKDAAPFIGYNPDEVAARGGAATVRQVNGAPRLLPDAPLRVEALKNFDARLKWTVRRLRAQSLPVSNINLGLTLDNSLLTLSPLSADLARGHVDSDIVINARRRPVFTDYDIRLAPTPMGTLLAGFGVEEAGTSGTVKARVKMTGSGDTVHKSLSTANGRIAVILPKGTFWTRNVQLSEFDVGTFVQKMFEDRLKEPVQINCGLIGFTVKNGVAAADPILIDTQKNVMIGRGGFSFRNESLDLAFRADSKKFSLFSGQSPVGIGGYFAAPGIDIISPELLTRAGAGLGLAVVASPVAAVLAFVDPGDAKGAACGPVLAGATAKSQRTTEGEARDDVGRGTTAKAEDGRSNKAERSEQRKKFLGIF